jgi:hypothetical protein
VRESHLAAEIAFCDVLKFDGEVFHASAEFAN